MVVKRINNFFFQQGRLVGEGPNQPVGTLTKTSPVVGFDPVVGTVTTRSGSTYLLGQPHQSFAKDRQTVLAWLPGWVK